MPQFDDDFDDDDDLDNDSDQSGSRLIRDLRKQRNQFGKENKTLREELDKLSKQVRERNVADVLSAKGINPKVAKFLPTDLDNTPESIAGWLTENADVFGIQLQQQPAPEQQQSQVADPQVAAHERMRAAEDGGQQAEGDVAIQQRLAAAGSVAELNEIMAKYGRQPV